MGVQARLEFFLGLYALAPTESCFLCLLGAKTKRRPQPPPFPPSQPHRCLEGNGFTDRILNQGWAGREVGGRSDSPCRPCIAQVVEPPNSGFCLPLSSRHLQLQCLRDVSTVLAAAIEGTRLLEDTGWGGLLLPSQPHRGVGPVILTPPLTEEDTEEAAERGGTCPGSPQSASDSRGWAIRSP